MLKLLMIEDSALDAELVLRTLRKAGFEIEAQRVETPSGLDQALATFEPDLILCDYTLPSFDGLSALRQAREQSPDVPFIFVSGTIGEERAIETMHLGAQDYILKDSLARLPISVERALVYAAEARSRREAERELSRAYQALDSSNQALKRANRELSAMFESSPIAVIVIDRDARVQVWNPAAERLSGWTAAEVIAQPLPLALSGDGPLRTILHQSGNELVDCEVRLETRTGATIDVELSATPLGDPHVNGGRSTLLMATDITARKRAERLLRRQRDELSARARIVGEILTGDDLPTLAMRCLNEVASLVGAPWGTLRVFQAGLVEVEASRELPPELARVIAAIPPDGEPPIARAWRAWRRGQAFPANALGGERPTLEDVGSIVWLPLPNVQEPGVRSRPAERAATADERDGGWVLLASPRSDAFGEDELLGVATLVEYVALAVRTMRLYTSLRSAYEELRHTQSAVMQQERLRSLGQMAAGIVHDINNALSPVLGFSELALQSDPSLSAATREALELIRLSAQTIAKTVERMRTFYRPRIDGEAFLPLDLPRVLDEVCKLTRPRWKTMAEERGIAIELTTDLDPELPITFGSNDEIREALVNLVFNAVDAMPNGGSLRIAVRAERSGGGTGDVHEGVVVTVADTGHGMDDEVRDRCLEPFFTTKGDRGTGLGLAMVYGTVQRHEGWVELDSAPGRGTAVHLHLPSAGRPELPRPTLQLSRLARPAQALQVLVIDDEPLVRTVVERMLRTDGHHAILAASGSEGLAIFSDALERAEPFDLVITDLVMPAMDGREVARSIRRASPDTPIVILTGWGARFGTDEREPVSTVADLVLTKPPTLKALRQAIDEIAGAIKDRA